MVSFYPRKWFECQRNTTRILLSFFILFLSADRAWSAAIQAELGRENISLNESFSLTFHAEGSVDDDPDFRPLEKDFDLLSQTQSSSMQIINGTVVQKKEWHLNLMPKKAGTFMIPPIHFGKDQSQLLMIKIEEPAAATPGTTDKGPLFFEVSATPLSAYVQSQILYTIRFFRSVTLVSASLSEPELSDADAVVEKLGDDRQFETTRNGQRYLVVERRYAIFPQQSGRLSVSPIQFEGQVISASQPRNFGFFNQGGLLRRLHSEGVTLDIKPIPQLKRMNRAPEDPSPRQWLPAQRLQIEETWPETVDLSEALKTGEPLTWTLTLKAEGLTAAQLPEIPVVIPDGFKSYPDQPELMNRKKSEGVTGIRQEKIALIPTAPGTYLLPAIEVPWWNTITNQMETARLPERNITVTLPPVGSQSSPLENESSPSSNTPILKPTPTIPLQGETPVTALPKTAQPASRFWSWLSLVLALAWGITLIAWWGARQKKTSGNIGGSEDQPVILPNLSEIKRQLEEACLKNDAAAAKEALLSWGKICFPARAASLGEIRKQTERPLSDEIQKLNEVLYGHPATIWQSGPALWAAFEDKTAADKKNPLQKNEGLAPMYP